MSQDEQAVETKAPIAAKEQEKEVETKVDETTTEAQEETQQDASTQEPNEIDYEAELTREREARKKAEAERENYKRGLLNAKSELKGKKEETVDETPGELTVDEFEKRLESKFDQKLKSFQAEQTRDLVDGALESLTDNPKERELIRFHYENSLNHSGYTRSAIKADLENARLLANRSKLLAENRELKEALKSKGSISNSGRGSNQDKIVTEDEPKLTPEERALLKRSADKEGISLKEYIRRNKTKLTT